MGQLYYKSVKESGTDVTAELDAYMVEADGIKAEIANLRRELAKAQGCVICAACGAQISNKSVFCPLCGVKLAAEEEETVADTETVEAETEQTTEE
jgi:hypothetical protein